MDIQQVATQLVSYLGNNPQLIQQFIQHPYSTTAQATGSSEQISRKDMSQIVTAAAALANNQKLGMGDVANIAAALLGQNNNSVHALTNTLFGGGTAAAQSGATAQSGPSLGSLVSMAAIAAMLMNGISQKPQAQQAASPVQLPVQPVQQQVSQPSVNLSDGLDIAEIATLAGQFLGGNTAAAAPKPQVTQQQAASGLDFGTIAQLASMFLKQ